MMFCLLLVFLTISIVFAKPIPHDLDQDIWLSPAKIFDFHPVSSSDSVDIRLGSGLDSSQTPSQNALVAAGSFNMANSHNGQVAGSPVTETNSIDLSTICRSDAFTDDATSDKSLRKSMMCPTNLKTPLQIPNWIKELLSTPQGQPAEDKKPSTSTSVKSCPKERPHRLSCAGPMVGISRVNPDFVMNCVTGGYHEWLIST